MLLLLLLLLPLPPLLILGMVCCWMLLKVGVLDRELSEFVGR